MSNDYEISRRKFLAGAGLTATTVAVGGVAGRGSLLLPSLASAVEPASPSVPALTIASILPVAQETSTPGKSNPYNDLETWSPNLGCLYECPPSSNDTRAWNIFGGGDLGLAWDAGDGSLLQAYGDAYGFDWVGPFVNIFSGAQASVTIAAASDGVNLETLNGTQTLGLSAGANLSTTGQMIAVRLQDGDFAYLKYVSRQGAVISGVSFVAGTGPGPNWTCHTSDRVHTADRGAAWTGLVKYTDFGWRSTVLARTTNPDITAGRVFSDMRPLSSAHTAVEVLHSKQSAVGTSTTYASTDTVPVMSIACVNSTWTCTATCSAPHGLVEGQRVLINGTSRIIPAGSAYGAHIINATTFSFLIVNVPTGTETPSSVLYFRFPNAATPTLAPEVTKNPSSGVAVPGAGVGGATRQYLFYGSITYGSVINYLGIAYSDDVGATWTDAAFSAKLGIKSNGKDISTLSVLYMATAGLPSSGQGLEVDTSAGVAYFSWTSKSATQLLGVTLTRGTPHATLATGNGVRYALWANNGVATAFHQAFGLWRPGDGYVYALTTDSGTGSPISNLVVPQGGMSTRLARCPEMGLLNKSAWSYWNGGGWSDNPSAAWSIFPADGGGNGTQVFYHAPSGNYVAATYAFDIQYRTAPALTGPWSSEGTVVRSADFNGAFIYGGWIVPWSNVSPTSGPVPTGPSGSVTTSISTGSQASDLLYFVVSIANPYATYLFEAHVT